MHGDNLIFFFFFFRIKDTIIHLDVELTAKVIQTSYDKNKTMQKEQKHENKQTPK